MVQTITPVVHGGSRRRWAGSVALHVLGATISAAALGLLLGAAGSVLGAPWGRAGMLTVAAVALAYTAREMFGLRVPVPELRRQVPESWRISFGPRTVAFLYGLALGPGFFTHLRHGTFVAASLAVVAVGDPLAGAVALAGFGFARAIGVSVVSAARTEPAVMAAGERLERLGAGNLPRIANAIALLALTAAAVVTSPPGSPAPWLWSTVLAAIFAWAAVAKLIRPAAWRESLQAYSLPAWLERIAHASVPMAEGLLVVLLLIGALDLGATLSLVLLGLFSASVLRARNEGTLPCGCFGGRKPRSIAWLLGRNLAIGSIAIGVLAIGRPIPIEAPGPDQALPALMVLGGISLAIWLFRRSASLLSRQEIGSVGTK